MVHSVRPSQHHQDKFDHIQDEGLFAVFLHKDCSRILMGFHGSPPHAAMQNKAKILKEELTPELKSDHETNRACMSSKILQSCIACIYKDYCIFALTKSVMT